MAEPSPIGWVEACWPFTGQVRALTTTRAGGVSEHPYAGFNLADHVGDSTARVAANRRTLDELLGGMPVQWLQQVHGTRLVEARLDQAGSRPVADGAWTSERGQVLAILTADCLPVVLVDRKFEVLAAVHAGWRGLVGGILAAACSAMPVRPAYAWLGPAIAEDVYEVGHEVLQALVDADEAYRAAIRPAEAAESSPGTRPKGYLDLFGLAELQLHRLGVETFTERISTWDTGRFYSYRREGRTGRMATLAWLPGRRG